MKDSTGSSLFLMLLGGVVDMALDKAIKYGKEKRKPYRGSKAVFASCRNHGSCPYCRDDRLFKFRDKHPDDTKTTTSVVDNMSE